MPTPCFFDGVGGIDRHLVIGCIAVFYREVVVFNLEIEIGKDQLFLDELPDDTGHFIAVEIDDRVGNLDLLHKSSSSIGRL